MASLCRLLKGHFKVRYKKSIFLKKISSINNYGTIRLSDRRNLLFLVSSLFLFRNVVLKPTSPQLQLSELDVGDS